MTKCKCGFVSQCATDSGSPIQSGDDGDWILLLTPFERIALAHCFFCGGKPRLESGSPCRCNSTIQWANVPGSCVRQDQRFGEFQIHYGVNKLIMHFCPACGGRLPSSRRNEFFLEPSASEMVEFDRILKDARSLEDVVKVLGEPDQRIGKSGIDDKDKDVFGVTIVMNTYLYSRVAKTFEVCAQEDVSGALKVVFTKKPKP